MKVPLVVALLFAVATSISGSTASAQPREERGGRVPYGPQMRPRSPPPQRTGDWVRLATPTPTRFGTEWIVVGPSAGTFRTLRIQATSGTVNLRRVRVEFTGGRVSTFHVNKRLNHRRPNARIDFGTSRYIERIVVTTARSPAGSYAVYGSWRHAPMGELVSLR
jgi:hypothetical protein